MPWNWLTQVFSTKNNARRAAGCVYPKRRPRLLLELELLETRVMPIVGGVAVAPGAAFDGVVQIAYQIPGGGTRYGSGSLLFDNNHILTAAHVVVGGTAAQVAAGAPAGKVTFNLIRQDGVPAGVPVNITLNVPANGGANQFQTVDPTFNPGAKTDDLAILTLPDQTPAPGQPTGRLVAPYYGPNSGYQLYSGNLLPNSGFLGTGLGGQAPPTVTLVGYGFTGTGLWGETNDEVQRITLMNPTPATTFTLSFNGATSLGGFSK